MSFNILLFCRHSMTSSKIVNENEFRVISYNILADFYAAVTTKFSQVLFKIRDGKIDQKQSRSINNTIRIINL